MPSIIYHGAAPASTQTRIVAFTACRRHDVDDVKKTGAEVVNRGSRVWRVPAARGGFRAPEDHVRVQRAERANRTIYASVRPTLQEANASDSLWLDAGLCMANASNARADRGWEQSTYLRVTSTNLKAPTGRQGLTSTFPGPRRVTLST